MRRMFTWRCPTWDGAAWIPLSHEARPPWRGLVLCLRLPPPFVFLEDLAVMLVFLTRVGLALDPLRSCNCGLQDNDGCLNQTSFPDASVAQQLPRVHIKLLFPKPWLLVFEFFPQLHCSLPPLTTKADELGTPHATLFMLRWCDFGWGRGCTTGTLRSNNK